MFTAEQRGGFKYWFAHWAAFQMSALNMGIWKPKYLLHDAEKPWLMLWAKKFHKDNPYRWVQQWHRHHNKHHIEYYIPVGLHHKGRFCDVISMLIDWECSRYTKESSQETAVEYFIQHMSNIPMSLRWDIYNGCKELGLEMPDNIWQLMEAKHVL